MRRAITAIVAIGLLVAGSYGLHALTETPETAPPSAFEQTPIPRLGEVERLISVFEERVAENGDPLDMSELGRLYLERAELVDDLGDYGSAIDSLEKSVDLAPEDQVAGLRLAQSYLAVHRFDEALGLASSLAASDSTDAAAQLVVADAQFELGDAKAAAGALEKVAALTGEIPEILTRRAQHADSMGDVPAALGYAEEALRITETEGSELRRLAFHLTFAAHFLNDLGRYEQAETMLNRAIEADPTWSSSRATLGAVLMSDGRLEEALTAYEGAASLSPDPGTLAILGDLSVALGDERRAEAFYDQVEPAASETPIHQDAYRRTLAQFLADHALEAERAVELAEVDVSQRSDPFGLDTYAWALYRAGRVEEARSQMDKVFDVGLREPQILYHSGLIALAEGNEKQARLELSEALDKAPMFHPLQAPHAKSVLESLEG
ncbi:MAG TPA: tetratricopeptide repeat protein [Acidimicrobiia bacterium]|jgi:tetratricopeptide (TPR) repeat protein|nr:tetratricopeptide repeat protein [Acidimicrobiia bacterium]HYJ24503.1 tetratricopeptide repeat protein [Acidimicrobiia bacterium]